MTSTSNERPMIMHVINDLSRGGAELLLINTVKLFPEFRHVIVYLFPNSELAEDFEEEGVELFCLHHKKWTNIFSSTLKLKAIIKKKKPVLVHSHLFQSTICSRLATPATVPLIFTIHSLYSQDAFGKNIKSLLAARLTLRKRHTLLAVSNCALNDYLTYMSFKGKRFILHNFLPDHLFQQRIEPRFEGTIKLVAVGNLKDAKNYHYLLQIFEHLRGASVSLDIYGTGPLQQGLAETIEKKKLNVRLCGTVENVSGIFQQYHFFIQASSHEGFGLSVIEAMATGIPVILSDIPVFREITDNLATFFPLENASFAARIITQLISRKEPGSFADKAMDHVKNKYSAKRYRQKLLSIYEEVAQRKLVYEYESVS